MSITIKTGNLPASYLTSAKCPEQERQKTKDGEAKLNGTANT